MGSPLEAPLSDWLQGPQHHAVLQKVCTGILPKARNLGLGDDLLPCATAEECVGELWLFLRNEKGSLGHEAARLIAEGDTTRFRTIVANAFLQRLIDKRRTTGRSPSHALYRRVRQILSKTPGIAYRPLGRGIGFACYACSGEEHLPTFPGEGRDAYTTWRSPPGAWDDPKKKTALQDLARLFWEEAARRSGGPVLVPIRDFVRYLQAQFPGTFGDPGRREVRIEEGEEGSNELPCDRPDEALYTRARLKDLAECLVAALDEKKRAILRLDLEENLTLGEIARQLGLKGPSGVHYQRARAMEILRAFCVQWPGLSPEDLDEGLWKDFIQEFLALCKTDPQGRKRD